jgi:ribosomal-protein-serine acetyltransferase
MRNLQQFREFVKDANKKAGQGLEIGCVIKLNNELAGRSGIYNIDNSKGSATIGYWIAEAHQGKGLITSSCRALIQHSFNVLQLKQLEIRCATNNVKSMAIAERLNFCRSGIIKNGEFFNHGFIDLFIYSLSKAEWQQQRETEQ